MPTIKLCLLLAVLLTCSVCYSQTNSPAFGLFSPEELNLKECSFDPEAEAIILLDEARTDYNGSNNMITTRRIRIKILRKNGIERANIVIPFYAEDNFEIISDIVGATHNFIGNDQVSSKLDMKTVYTEKINKYFSVVKFPMPQVKEGSIIEYSYKSVMESFTGLENWDFQSDIPTLKSSYLLYTPKILNFTYSIQKDPSLFVKTEQVPDSRGMLFEMYNVPALRVEPFMDARNDYVQRIVFQISGVLQRSGNFTMDINKTWKSLAYGLLTSREFGKLIDKKVTIEELKLAVENENSPVAKTNKIYSYVRDNFTWNGINSKFAEGFDEILKTRTGHSGEINLLLINLLTSFNLETKPMLVSERYHGKINPGYPYLEKFNKVVAFCVVDGKQFIMDATQKFTPINLVPDQLLNTTAFVVDKKNQDLVNISSKKSHKNNLFINANLESNGELHGDVMIQSYDYTRLMRLMQIKERKDDFFFRAFEEPYEAMSINNPEVDDPGVDSAVLFQRFNFTQQVSRSGEFIFLRYNLFTGLEQNPFISFVRLTDINFGFPYEMTSEETIKLPAVLSVELPETKTLKTSDGKIIIHRDIKHVDSTIKVKLIFIQSITNITAGSYPELKEFYKSMIDMLNEPIILKMKN